MLELNFDDRLEHASQYLVSNLFQVDTSKQLSKRWLRENSIEHFNLSIQLTKLHQ